MVLGFLGTGFCNISGGPSEIPTRLACWAAGLVAQPGCSKGTLRQTGRYATWQYSGFSFRLVFRFSGRPSPDWTHWRDGPTHQEWPQDQVRPRGQAPARSYPNRQKTGLSSGLPGRQQQLRKPGDSGEGRHCDNLWMIVSAWLLNEWVREIFLFGNCKTNSFWIYN